MTDLDLSFIIPLYNAELYIKDCLSSLVSQGIDPSRYEIIVVDDGSKDNSLKVAKEFSAIYSNIFIIEQENQGVGAARNNGVEQARGTYIYFIDADDYLAQSTLYKLLDNALIRNLDVLCFKSTDTTERNLFLSENPDRYKIDDQIYTGIEFIANSSIRFAVWWFIAKKEFLLSNNMRFIEGIFFEDVIYALELFVAAERVSSTTLDVYRYYQNPTSIMHSKEEVHTNKIIQGYKYAINKMDEVINKLALETSNDKCIENIKYWQHYFIFLLLAKLITRSSIRFKAFRDHFNELKKNNMYPISYYPGKKKIRKIYKMAVYCFNRPFILFTLTYAVKVLNLGKYLQRSRRLGVR
jgi:glycosyltransferase involved in cell wall biosynthesis